MKPFVVLCFTCAVAACSAPKVLKIDPAALGATLAERPRFYTSVLFTKG